MSGLPDGFEWACPGGSDTWGIRRMGAWKTLCGDRMVTGRWTRGFCPVVQPENPQPQCTECVAKLEEIERG